MNKISAILMASGFSTRMKEHKAFLLYKNKTFIENIIEKLLQSEVFEIKVIIGNEDILEFTKLKFNHEKIQFVFNKNAILGQSWSIKLGVSMCKNTDAFMFFVLDQPLISVKSINVLINSFTKNTIISPKFGSISSSPKIFCQSLRKELLSLENDVGGREVIKNHLDMLKTIYIKNEEEAIDIDTKEEYEIFIRKYS